MGSGEELDLADHRINAAVADDRTKAFGKTLLLDKEYSISADFLEPVDQGEDEDPEEGAWDDDADGRDGEMTESESQEPTGPVESEGDLSRDEILQRCQQRAEQRAEDSKRMKELNDAERRLTDSSPQNFRVTNKLDKCREEAPRRPATDDFSRFDVSSTEYQLKTFSQRLTRILCTGWWYYAQVFELYHVQVGFQ